MCRQTRDGHMWKRILGVAALTVVMSAARMPVQAQGPGQRGGRGPNLDEQMERLVEQLELTDEQAESVRAVLEMQGERRREVFQGGSGGGDREAMRAAMAELREETNLQLAEILTEEQMVKFREIQASRRRGPPPLRG